MGRQSKGVASIEENEDMHNLHMLYAGTEKTFYAEGVNREGVVTLKLTVLIFIMEKEVNKSFLARLLL